MSGSFFPTIVSIVILIGILYLAHFASKLLGTSTMKRTSSKYIKLLDMMSIGQDKALAAINVGDKVFLIGITPGAITKITDLEEEDLQGMLLEEDGSQEGNPVFKDLLSKIKKG